MKRHLIVLGAAFALLVGLTSAAFAQAPPPGCYLADDGTFRDDVTGELCVDEVQGVAIDRVDLAAPSVGQDGQLPAAAPATRVAAAGAQPAQLAQTGLGLSTGAVLGLVLVLVGAGLVLMARRRSMATSG